jgi:hypothetical protein
MTAQEALKKTKDAGIGIVFPEVSIEPFELNKDIAETVRDVLLGESGSFKTKEIISIDDVLWLIGVEDDLHYDDLLDELLSYTFLPPPGWTGETTETLLFFRSDDPYPGTNPEVFQVETLNQN